MIRLHAILSLTCGLLAFAGTGHAASETLPWLEDPFGGQKKIEVYGKNLKPEICPDIPEIKEQLTLTQVVTLALCNNPSNRNAYLSLLSSADSFASSYAAYLPNISGSWGRSRSRNFSARRDGKSLIGGDNDGSLSASLTLYDFGQREFGIEAAEITLATAGRGFDQTMQTAIRGAIASYYALLEAQNARELAQLTRKTSEETLDAARLRHELGLVPLKDKLDAEVGFLEQELLTENSERNLKNARASLAQLLGLPALTMISVADIDDTSLTSDPFEASSVTGLIEEAKNKRIDMANSRASLESAKLALERLKRSNLGTISVTTSASFDRIDITDRNASRGQSIGISVGIPIFTGFSQTYNTRITKRAIESAEESIKSLELQIEQSVLSAWNTYQSSRKNWEISWDRLSVATQARDITLGRYKEGLGTILDVLTANQNYQSALNSQLSSRIGLLNARLDLINAIGALSLDVIEPKNYLAEPSKTDILPAPTPSESAP